MSNLITWDNLIATSIDTDVDEAVSTWPEPNEKFVVYVAVLPDIADPETTIPWFVGEIDAKIGEVLSNVFTSYDYMSDEIFYGDGDNQIPTEIGLYRATVIFQVEHSYSHYDGEYEDDFYFYIEKMEKYMSHNPEVVI